MSEKIVSPGVFTQEKDFSYLPKGLGEIGAVFIGRTNSGPAFKPTVISSYNDFDIVFGAKNENMMLPYAVNEYLRSGNRATVVRVLSKNDTFSYSPGTVEFIDSDGVLLSTLKPT
jgi:hypothetical protein